MTDVLIIPEGLSPQKSTIDKIKKFLKEFNPLEMLNKAKLLLYIDEKSKAYYIVCHIDGKTLASNCDLEASLNAEDEEIYKLNRDITEDQSAYKNMEKDALSGRGFEDMVLEYDTAYNENKPLKVYGGQHRITAITKAKDTKGSIYHGVRVYFDLSREQKVEIATVNNTSIAVPNDLLDRMREQLIGNELRDWCQSVGLLNKGEDFSDRRSPEVPTVRLIRTLVVNYYRGLNAKDDEFHQPVVCKSGGMDEDYLEVRKKVDWVDKKILEMGKQFARLHKMQRDRVLGRENDNYAEFARKALSLAVVASWAYAAGFFQKQPEFLKHLYALPESAAGHDDPLNAKALSQARHKLTDPDTYRGLGTRSSPAELGRMFEVFLILATKATKKSITKELANAAIQSYEAKKATFEANKVLGKI